MKFLIVGAGAVGGYYGGRLVEKGADVTFLVRPGRQQQLQERGLVIRSVQGDFSAPVQSITAADAATPFDVIILSVKSYHLPSVIEEVRPFAGNDTLILPLLNGYRHYVELQDAFGHDKVLGGLCSLETTLDSDGTIVHTSPLHDLTFGEWDGGLTPRVQAVQEQMEGANFNSTLHENVRMAVWHKYILIAAMSGITTLMRSPIGPILSNNSGRTAFDRLLSEIVTIAKRSGAPVAENVEERIATAARNMKYSMKASMLRDMEKGQQVEAEHLQGYLLAAAEMHDVEAPVLQAAYGNLKIYEILRQEQQ
jgi:2-dehydropantoate 2-reductase